MRAATCWRIPMTTARRSTRCLPRGICVADSRWWCGRSARAGSVRVRWMSSLWEGARCRGDGRRIGCVLRFGARPSLPRSDDGDREAEERVAYQAFDLTGKVALVTGGNGGIGLGIAKAVAEAGADVAIWGTNAAKNAAAEAELAKVGSRVVALQCDVGDEAAVDAVFART